MQRSEAAKREAAAQGKYYHVEAGRSGGGI